MILNSMLGSGFGGLEKLFLDEVEMLPMAGMPARCAVRRGSPLARYARERNLPCDEILALSDWDPISVAGARTLVRRAAPKLVMCVGRKAHRLFGRAVGTSLPIVTMVQKRRFDRDFPHAGVLVAATHRRGTLIEDGVAPENIIVIPNSVRLPPPKADYAIAPGRPVTIVGLGRLHEKKGFGVLIKALRILAASAVAFDCSIAGEGPERASLQRAVDKAGLADRIKLPGWTDDVATYLSAADIFALPSFQEDFPLAVLDAMASGVPIVASRIDGPKDFLVDGETALIVPPNDAPALAEALSRLIADQGLRERLGRNARREAEQKYSFEAIGRRLVQALDNVLAGKPISFGA
jgi:glycosyltransferase involved in cell wall biosynthesis